MLPFEVNNASKMNTRLWALKRALDQFSISSLITGSSESAYKTKQLFREIPKIGT